MNYRFSTRVILVLLILGTSAYLVWDNQIVTPSDPYEKFQETPSEPFAPPRNGTTVVTSDKSGHLVAFNPDGTILYYNDSHFDYFDVDPVPNESNTVVYPASDKFQNDSVCDPVGENDYCRRQYIEQVNLSTGNVTVLYEKIEPRYHLSQWHDVDRLSETHYVVTDTYSDEVFIIDVESNLVVWEWSVQNYHSIDSAGPFPRDWAHVNDVEVVDGRIMVSLRNHDQVIFLDENGQVVENWTLGQDSNHEIYFEQYNPDYLPPDAGGPAILAADSFNNRIVEFQRTERGGWRQSWTWNDSQLQWPTDADRLPNGNTMISDTYGDRIIEVDATGAVVWELSIDHPYEAERLGTGDESAGGQSASRLELRSQVAESGEPGTASKVKSMIRGIFPEELAEIIEESAPPWMEMFDLLAIIVLSVSVIVWVSLEWIWSDYSYQTPIKKN